jgi:CDP-glycerol glycerophosphotransferase (TagB/SpsB family)
VTLEDEQLAGAGVPLYGLLARSAGIITDYSSVWTDYLLLDRPIGFFIPDRDDYAGSRGLYPPDALTWLPGPELDSPESFRAFAAEVIAGESTWAQARREAAERLGLNPTRSAARDLLDELERRGALRKTRTFRVGDR